MHLCYTPNRVAVVHGFPSLAIHRLSIGVVKRDGYLEAAIHRYKHPLTGNCLQQAFDYINDWRVKIGNGFGLRLRDE